MRNIIGSAIAAWRSEMAARRDIDERRNIAKAFNNRYCYRVQYEKNAAHLVGTAMPRGGNRWMCPDCNKIHSPVSCSVWTGLQYPACCSTFEGHRLSHGVRVAD